MVLISPNFNDFIKLENMENPKGMFGWVDFREDEKKGRENGRENTFDGCLVEGRGEKKNWRDSSVFSTGPRKCFLSN